MRAICFFHFEEEEERVDRKDMVKTLTVLAALHEFITMDRYGQA
jgi:hypothetical protein